PNALTTAHTILEAMNASRLAALRETVLVCVQCGKDYRESENADGACSFHPVSTFDRPDAYSYVLRCCGKSFSEFETFPEDGCGRGRHAYVHHWGVDYVNFLGSVRVAVQGADPWLTVTQYDSSPDSQGPITITFGLLRSQRYALWISQFNVAVALATFDEVDIEAPTHFSDGKNILISPEINGETTPFLGCKRNKILRRRGVGWFARGMWVVEGGRITGVRLEAKAPFSEKANVANSFRKIPSIAFENNLRVPEFEQEGDLKLRIKPMKPVAGNPDGSNYRADNFKLDLMLISTAQPQSKGSTTSERLAILTMVSDAKITVSEAERDDPITIVDITVTISLDSGKTWIPATGMETSVSSTTLGDQGAFSVMKMASREVVKVGLLPWFNVTGKKRGWNGEVFLAREMTEALLVKVRVEEAFGRWAALTMGYRNPPVRNLPEKSEKIDYLFVYVDDVDDLSRVYGKISRPTPEVDTSYVTGRVLFSIISYNSVTITHHVTPVTLRSWIHRARQEPTKSDGLTTLLLDDVTDQKVKVWGLFDFSGAKGKGAEGGVIWGIKMRVTLDEEGESFAEDTWVLNREVLG
ncbi:hypothetical protein BC829DRAFT_384787, partial [Chytridium lagenaria]